jgi:hypothetical protein
MKPTTIAEAKQYLRDNWEKGCECPACGQRVQRYDYKLFATSAYALVLLYRLDKQRPNEKWFHVSEYAEANEGKIRAPHFAELRFWNLIEKRPYNDDPKKKSSGYWCITDRGRQFAERKLKVQSRILVFNNKFQGYSDKSELIDIKEAFGNVVNYQEIMNPNIVQESIL